MITKYDIPKEDKKSLEALFSNIELIWQNRKLICAADDYYNIYIIGTGICLPHLEVIPLFLGDLLQLWEQTQWCQNNAYTYFIAGSTSYDNNISHTWSYKYGFVQKSIKDISDLGLLAFSLINTGAINNEVHLHRVASAHKISSKLNIFDLIAALKGENQ